ncbi:MAG: hypothetical protein AB2L12_14290 [Smithellaceae bacterium]
MESGFSALAQVAATLFGLVLVSLVFAYTTAIARIDSIGDFSHFASWVWAAGFSCFLYFSCCFLLSFRLMEDKTWVPALEAIVVAITIFLIISLYKETHWLRIMVLEDSVKFRGLFWSQVILPFIIFIFFQLSIWKALTQSSEKSLEWDIYNALTYTLFFAAMRAVILVGASFSAIIILHGCNSGKNH